MPRSPPPPKEGWAQRLGKAFTTSVNTAHTFYICSAVTISLQWGLICITHMHALASKVKVATASVDRWTVVVSACLLYTTYFNVHIYSCIIYIEEATPRTDDICSIGIAPSSTPLILVLISCWPLNVDLSTPWETSNSHAGLWIRCLLLAVLACHINKCWAEMVVWHEVHEELPKSLL